MPDGSSHHVHSRRAPTTGERRPRAIDAFQTESLQKAVEAVSAISIAAIYLRRLPLARRLVEDSEFAATLRRLGAPSQPTEAPTAVAGGGAWLNRTAVRVTRLARGHVENRTAAGNGSGSNPSKATFGYQVFAPQNFGGTPTSS